MKECRAVVVVKEVHDIPRKFCNINQAKQYLQRYPIPMTECDHNYIFEYIEHRDKISDFINNVTNALLSIYECYDGVHHSE